MITVLIIDDDANLALMLARYMESLSYRAVSAHSLADGIACAARDLPDVVLLDVRLPDGSGVDGIEPLRAIASRPEVIVMTGMGDGDIAELSVRRGAWSYVLKGNSLHVFGSEVRNALAYRAAAAKQAEPIDVVAAGIAGGGGRMRTCLDEAAACAASDAPVLLHGETGTGKEVIARAIHGHSARRGFNFVVVDCAALPEQLVEGILFGHVRGAYTGADRASEGLVKQADGGTLFLDEVGELPLPMQRAFLRVLQERRFRPLGAAEEVISDFRLLAATNRDLDAMVRQDRFRADLLYRLRSMAIELPPLRERNGDAVAIAQQRASTICRRYGLGMKTLSEEYIGALQTYAWPGNVRELVQAIEHSVGAAQHADTLYVRHLPENIRIALVRRQTEKPHAGASAPASHPPVAPASPTQNLKTVREAAADRAEQAYLKDLLESTRGDVTNACAIAGVSRSRFYALLKKHGISSRPR